MLMNGHGHYDTRAQTPGITYIILLYIIYNIMLLLTLYYCRCCYYFPFFFSLYIYIEIYYSSTKRLLLLLRSKKNIDTYITAAGTYIHTYYIIICVRIKYSYRYVYIGDIIYYIFISIIVHRES